MSAPSATASHSAVPSSALQRRESTLDMSANTALELHNKFRNHHNSPPLNLDLSLCQQAEAYAQCIANGVTPASSCDSYGRNIHKIQIGPSQTFQGRTEAVREAITTWYSHSREYNWKSPCSSPAKAKLFAQIVWKASKSLGVGVGFPKSTNGKFNCVVLCLYAPTGIVLADQKFKENVFRPRKP